jgi:hypothetical protein
MQHFEARDLLPASYRGLYRSEFAWIRRAARSLFVADFPEAEPANEDGDSGEDGTEDGL